MDSKNQDIRGVIMAAKQAMGVTAAVKVDRTKLVENSRKKFYDNLKTQLMEEGPTAGT